MRVSNVILGSLQTLTHHVVDQIQKNPGTSVQLHWLLGDVDPPQM